MLIPDNMIRYLMRTLSRMRRRCTTMKFLQLLAAVVFLSNRADVRPTEAAFFISRQNQPWSVAIVRTVRTNACGMKHAARRTRHDSVISLYGVNDEDQDTSNSSTSMESASTTTLIRTSKSPTTTTKKTKNANGVYIRPSAAIERGSGFFVPGLEGYKVRLFVGSIVVVLTVLLHFYHTSTSSTTILPGENISDSGNNFAESLAIFYGLLVLLQGSIEARKDIFTTSNSNDSISTINNNGQNIQVYQQQWSIEVSDTEWRDKVEWVASTYLSLTSATNMILIGPGKIIFSLGTTARPSNAKENDADEVEGCHGALATVAQSKSGCLSLPMNHVTVRTLLSPSSTTPNDLLDNPNVNSSPPRSVVLQRINDQLCWMMVSDQLLASFTTNDVQWLGQLAQYTNPE